MCTILGHGHQHGKAIGCHKLWGPLNLATGGGLGSPKARPGPPMGHLIAPTCCMPALVGQLGPWGHWVVAPGAHTTPPWVQWGAQAGPIPVLAAHRQLKLAIDKARFLSELKIGLALKVMP